MCTWLTKYYSVYSGKMVKIFWSVYLEHSNQWNWLSGCLCMQVWIRSLWMCCSFFFFTLFFCYNYFAYQTFFLRAVLMIRLLLFRQLATVSGGYHLSHAAAWMFFFLSFTWRYWNWGCFQQTNYFTNKLFYTSRRWPKSASWLRLDSNHKVERAYVIFLVVLVSERWWAWQSCLSIE